MPQLDSCQSKGSRCRYLLLGPDGFLTEENGLIAATEDSTKAYAFVDVDAAAERGQTLISIGIPVHSIVPFSIA